MSDLKINDLLNYALDSGASDLHLSVGSNPMVRINGEMKKLQLPITDLKSMEKIRDEILNQNQTLDLDKIIPLTSLAPSEKEIQFLIQSWLKGKADILNGLESEILIKVARPSLFNRVIDQRKKDNLLGQKQIIDASITSIKIVQRSKNRIAADVDLNYKDKRISSSGDVLAETVIPSLKVKYILGKNKNNWQVVDYISGN